LEGSAGKTLVGSDVSDWADQGGDGHNFSEAVNRPSNVATVTALASKPGVAFDGNLDVLTGAAISNFFSSTGFHLTLAFVADSISSNTASPIYSNDCVLVDSAGYWGLHLRTTSANIYVWDTAPRKGTQTIAAGTGYVFSAKLEGGQLFTRLNNDAWVSGDPVPGPIGNMGGLLKIANNGAFAFTGKIAEIVLCDAPLSNVNEDALAAYMSAKYETV
jgi:hypothetical protein